MGVPDSEMLSHGEVESTLQTELQHNNKNPFSSLGRQSSIYSLTLDEFQHTLCESGKNFGSMNMDEFLTSIWNAEENQAVATNNNNANDNAAAKYNNNNNANTTNLINNRSQVSLNGASLGNNVIAKQPSLPRQGSLTLPAPLCRKTVDEVWSEIHRGQQGQQQSGTGGNNEGSTNNNSGNVTNTETATRQPTFGEMTLEDFLIKAGVVREHCGLPPQQQAAPQQQFGLYQSNNNNTNVMSPGFSTRPVMGMTPTGGGTPGGTSCGVGAVYQQMPPGHGGVIGEASGPYVGADKRSNGGYPGAQRVQQPPPPPAVVCYGGIAGNVGGFGTGMVGPVSPGVSSEGVCNPQLDGGGGQYGMEMGGLRGKKRIVDGPVEKVVERRQRRMIKNRESAARSRARKQAYTVELEAELNQLKEENTQLKQALAELDRKRKQQYFEELKMMKAYTKAQRAKEKLRVMRRNLSCPL